MIIVSQFFRELRRRGVFGTTAIYVVAAWVLVQVASEVFPAFNIPEFAIRYVWIGVALGFPLALIVGWMYDISPRGINRTPQTGSDEGADTPLKRFDFLVLSGIAVVAVGLVFILLGKIMNFPEPVLVQTTAREADPNSVAVLPLDNFTGDPDQEYFVAGLHEALTAGLTGISALKVISRTSASAFVNTDKTLPEIGRALGVANIIEGSVFRSGDRVRITVQLINALTDEHLWAENYEREIVDMLALHGEVTRAIARQIQVTLTPEEDSRLSEAREVDPAIYQLYLKGMYFLKQYTPEGIQKGLPYLHQAVELDPANARAYAGLALGYNTIGHGIGRDAFPKALAAARQALALDEYSGEAWAALAESQLYHDYNWEDSDRSFKRALQLAPSLDHAHAHYAYLLALLGRWDEVFAQAEKARELSPLDPTWAFFAGWLYMVREDFDRAEELMLESLELAPSFPFGLFGLGDLYKIQGRIEEAIELQERIPAGSPIRNWALGPTYASAGREADALKVAAEMSVDPGPKDRLFLAFTYAALGDFDEAMRWFEICFEIETRTDWLPWIALDQSFGGVLEGIREDPRFQSLIKKLNLAHYSTDQ
jgi:TolB-like protein/tetratricopeptide (TPR) repeat protein